MKKRWNSFDCLKGLACLAVVLIHFNFEGNFGIAVKTFCRFGVPVFFLTSGFFFLSDGKMDDGKVAKKMRHILKLVLASGVFYAVFTIMINLATNGNWEMRRYAAERLTADRIAKFFVTNDPFVYSHLWFLMGLFYCYVFCLLFFENNKRLGWVIVLAPALLITYSCLQEFSKVLGIQSSIPIPRSENRIYLFNIFIFRALPFFLFGMLLNRYREKIAKIPLSKRETTTIAIIGCCLAVVERFNFGEAQFYVGTYLALAVMFIAAVKNPDMNNRLLRHIGAELSLYVYIFHIAVGRCIDVFFGALGWKKNVIYVSGRAIIILLVSLLMAEAIYRGKRRLLGLWKTA